MSDEKEGADEEEKSRAEGQTQRYACPCCGNHSLSERGGFEICAFCSWEDDGQDDEDAEEVRGGPNGRLSLAAARRNYAAHGTCEEPGK